MSYLVIALVLDAMKQLMQRSFQVEGHVNDVPEESESPAPADSEADRTVIVTGVREPLTMEVLELWLESEDNGGGSIETITDDVTNGVVTAIFDEAQRTRLIVLLRFQTLS